MTREEKIRLAQNYINPFVRLYRDAKKAKKEGIKPEDITLTPERMKNLDRFYQDYNQSNASPEIRAGVEVYLKIKNHDS